MDAATQHAVGPDDVGVRLDRFVTLHCSDLSRNQVQRLNALGGIAVDGRARPDSFALSAGQIVSLNLDLLAPPGRDAGGAPTPQDIPVDVVFEDDDIVVVNKRAGMVVHPAHGNWEGTVVNALLGRGTSLSLLGGNDRPGVVHRLDKDTSGLMVLARTDAAYRGLSSVIKERRFDKIYHAIAVGHLRARRFTVDAPIGRHPVKRQQMAVLEDKGRPAITDLFVVDRYCHFDYIRLTTHTGRTHQIRVHLTHVGNPVLGDPVYGGRKQKRQGSHGSVKTVFERLLKILPRHALHASGLSFQHPRSGNWMRFTIALPEDMQVALETIYREDRIKEVQV